MLFALVGQQRALLFPGSAPPSAPHGVRQVPTFVPSANSDTAPRSFRRRHRPATPPATRTERPPGECRNYPLDVVAEKTMFPAGISTGMALGRRPRRGLIKRVESSAPLQDGCRRPGGQAEHLAPCNTSRSRDFLAGGSVSITTPARRRSPVRVGADSAAPAATPVGIEDVRGCCVSGGGETGYPAGCDWGWPWTPTRRGLDQAVEILGRLQAGCRPPGGQARAPRHLATSGRRRLPRQRERGRPGRGDRRAERAPGPGTWTCFAAPRPAETRGGPAPEDRDRRRRPRPTTSAESTGPRPAAKRRPRGPAETQRQGSPSTSTSWPRIPRRGPHPNHPGRGWRCPSARVWLVAATSRSPRN